MKVKIFAVVLHYRGRKLTLQNLDSLAKIDQNKIDFSVVLIDNCSPEPIIKLNKEVSLIKNEKNLGFAQGNNVGIRYALEKGANYILILNNDTIVDKDFLVYLIKPKNLIGEIGILAPKIFFAPGYEYHKNRYKEIDRGKVFWYAGGIIDWDNVYCHHRGIDEVDRGQYNNLEETDFASGCAMLVKREVFEKIGLLDWRYFLYLEDVDFCLRAKKAGFKIIYVPQAKVWHYNSASSEVGGNLQDYFITRNRMLLGMKYAPFKTKLSLAKESLGLFFNGRRWQKIGIRDFYLQKFGKGSWKS